jgi:hypothetical protein
MEAEMSERTFGRKKATPSTFSHPSLVSPTTPTLANPTGGFGLPTNNVIQAKTEVSTDKQKPQSADNQLLELQALREKTITHDISRISVRSPQAKLTVGEAGDKYEQEADMMANRVMSMPASTVQREAILDEEIQTKSLNTSIQRDISQEEEELQTKPVLQRATNGTLEAGDSIQNQLNSSKGGGSPLADEVRSFMEPRFGVDFSQVRVHTDSEAVQMNRELGAQAFTHGSDVYFGGGKAPGNNELTAHELTHVVQQTGSVQTKPASQQPMVLLSSTPAIQRDLNSDISDSLILEDWSRAVNLLNQLNDVDLNAQVRQQSPEWLLRLQRSARQARLTRVVQAIQNVQIRTGIQVDNFEGTTFRTPVTLFQSGVIISKDIQFVKRGRFRSNNDFEMLKNRIINSVRTYLTNRFKLKIETPGGAPQPGDGEYSIRVQFIDNPSASYRMLLFGQRHGRSGVLPNQGSIYELGMPGETHETDTTLAHESAHILLGAHDEYADAEFPARPVFTDHSLMGNYPSEGSDQAELKPRHFGALVQLVNRWFPGRNVSIIQ